MGDRLRADKLSWYVTSEPGQLSLVIHPRIGTRSTSLGLEGNRTSGIALVYPPTATGLNGLHQGDEHPACSPSGIRPVAVLGFSF